MHKQKFLAVRSCSFYDLAANLISKLIYAWFTSSYSVFCVIKVCSVSDDSKQTARPKMEQSALARESVCSAKCLQ